MLFFRSYIESQIFPENLPQASESTVGTRVIARKIGYLNPLRTSDRRDLFVCGTICQFSEKSIILHK